MVHGAMPCEAQSKKMGSRWHEIWIFTTCSRTGGLDELDKQTDSLLSTIWWSKFVDFETKKHKKYLDFRGEKKTEDEWRWGF